MKPTIKNRAFLRVILGISQPDFAAYLGVTRTQVAMYEQGTRDLPAAAMVRLGEMEKMRHALEQSGDAKTIQPPTHTKTKARHKVIKEKLKQQVDDCSYRLIGIQLKLDKMILENTRAETWWKLLHKMMEALPAGKNNEADQAWLEIQQAQTINKMVRHGIASQSKLLAARQVLQAEMKVCKSLLKKL